MTLSSPSLILIVDDTPTNAKVLFDVLKDQGFRVLLAQSGESALEKLQVIHPDLILLDVMMPGIDGFETCRRLKASPSTEDIPVIFMTALSETTNKVQGFEVGAVDYLTKPLQQEEVLARVNAHLRVRKLNQELQQLNQTLESRVTERTAELSSALAQLQQSQLHLVQHEKMSALGQMVAGIAHEINNPVGFIAGNLAPALDYIDDLFGLIDLYEKTCPHAHAELATAIAEIDLDYVREDLPKLLSSMQEGVKRIHNISTSLRSFSRVDTEHPTRFDLHEGIDSTLMILGHRLKACGDRPEIKINKRYGDLPLVECYPGQLNQVFVNILGNAIDALEERHQRPSIDAIAPVPDTIQISTEVINSDWIQIHISDNGLGMSEETRSRLFQPFFTTKPVGKGTGMGLSISQQIVIKNHHGNLYCHSTPGVGTEFVIEIPCLTQGYPPVTDTAIEPHPAQLIPSPDPALISPPSG